MHCNPNMNLYNLTIESFQSTTFRTKEQRIPRTIQQKIRGKQTKVVPTPRKFNENPWCAYVVAQAQIERESFAPY